MALVSAGTIARINRRSKMPITTIRIHPALGIARVGNSPDSFVGPEVPGTFTPPAGGYKDSHCRVKRQACRFRLFAFDENGAFVQEITAADADVSWTVHLVNRKSAALKFKGGLASNPPPDPTAPDPTPAQLADPAIAALWRNATVVDRSELVIDPGPRTLTGPSQEAGFNTGRFLGSLVPLGEMRTDEEGRLLVLGGFGRSGTAGPPLVGFADNDGWHDDVSDGPVTAMVTLSGGGGTFSAAPAWVIVGPPKFAPAIQSPSSLYDSLLQVAKDQNLLPVGQPTFTLDGDVKPFFDRLVNLKWVSKLAANNHSAIPGTFPPGGTWPATLLGKLRKPTGVNPPGANMPYIWSDTYQANETITALQYEMVENWVAGTLPGPALLLPIYEQLDRAALEPCVGENFYPGIEASWGLRNTWGYAAPFRLDHSTLQPGDVTKQMSVPWQADFFACQLDGGLAWWPANRPDDVIPEGESTSKVWASQSDPTTLVKSKEEMVQHWHKLGFVVPLGAQQVERERHAVCRNIFFVHDRSHISKDEVQAAGTPAQFDAVFYVVAEGFTPAEFGLTSPTDVGPAPALTLTVDGGAPVSISETAQQPLLEVNDLTVRQRVTYPYRLTFAGIEDFGIAVNRTLHVDASKVVGGFGTFSSAGDLVLTHTPNPYMLDGPTSWLSTDLRVFKIAAGETLPFATMPTITPGTPAQEQADARTKALDFINQLITGFRGLPNAGHPFETQLPTIADSMLARLELAEKDLSDTRVFNFAVARVRYRGAAPATGVRVFFRLFTTAATGLDYDVDSTYRRSPGAAPVALLGVQANKLVTIPFFARPRVDTSTIVLDTVPDALNVLDLGPSVGTTEFQSYFGCWLDFNQVTPQFPADVAGQPDGPWAAGRQSIQELIRGLHQCMVAEVHLAVDPIDLGSTPAAHDNLSQRNLVIDESGNPNQATHIVQHTLEIKATRPAPRAVVTEVAGVATVQRQVRFQPAGPDELMIRWGTLPRDTRMTLYLPDIPADDVIGLAVHNGDALRLERVDDHTLRCLPGDVTYVPLPTDRQRNSPALLTLELPPSLEGREAFDLVVSQLSGRPRTSLGAFQMRIVVRADEEALLRYDIHKLSVLRHVFNGMAPADRWRPVFERYLDQIASRVRALGGNPDAVAPSADGSGRDPEAERCARRGSIAAILLALFTVLAGWLPASVPALLAIGVATAIVWAWWFNACRPSFCQKLAASAIGLGLGAAALAVLSVLGLAGSLAPAVLAVAALLLAGVLLTAVASRCLKLS
jgi:L-Lysine epsilon oxidase N-terminal/L-lysine epsilon oxidase C-terminal domain